MNMQESDILQTWELLKAEWKSFAVNLAQVWEQVLVQAGWIETPKPPRRRAALRASKRRAMLSTQVRRHRR